MTEAERAAFEALSARVKQLERTVKMLGRDFQRYKADVQAESVAGEKEPLAYTVQQLPDGITLIKPILQ